MTDEKQVLTEHARLCGCGRSPTGYCNGNHKYTPEEWDRKLLDDDPTPKPHQVQPL